VLWGGITGPETIGRVDQSSRNKKEQNNVLAYPADQGCVD
jgi:hypothetical protein